MKTFGNAIAIQTAGPTAVEPELIEERIVQAADLLARAMHDQMRRLQTLGYEIDADSIDHQSKQFEDHHLLRYTFRARQTRGLIERLLWAARL